MVAEKFPERVKHRLNNEPIYDLDTNYVAVVAVVEVAVVGVRRLL